MNSRKKNTFIHLAFSYLNNIIAFINGIVIVPFYLSYIDITTYGAWLATGNILTWLTIADPGTSNVTIQRIAKTVGKHDQGILAYQTSSSIVISFIASSICLIAGLILSNYIASIMALKGQHVIEEAEGAFRLAMVGVAIALFEYSVYAIMVGLQKQFYTGVARITGRVIGIIVTFVLVIKGYGIKSIAMGVLVTNSVALSLNLFFFKQRNIPFKWSGRYFKSYIKIFSLTFFSRVFSSLYENIDLILVSRFLNPAVVAQLEITRRPMRFIQGFLMAPSQSLMPTLANYFGHNKPTQARELIEKIVIGFFCIFFITGLGFMMFNELLIKIWVGEKYFIGSSVNTILSISIIVTMFNYILTNINVSLGNIKGTSYGTMTSSILGLLFLMGLGYSAGLPGIVAAPVITIVGCQLWYYLYYINKKVNLSRLLWINLGKIIVLGLLVYAGVYLVSNSLAEYVTVNYWLLAAEGIVLTGTIFLVYVVVIREFRVLLFHDILKFFKKEKS